MSCNGCRVLRKGCSESCILRPCLQWMDTPQAQGNATLFVAKFFGRADLMSFISAVPLPQRPALFQSLLFEACGRTINPVSGAVGLLASGNWHVCQAAVQTVLTGGVLRPIPQELLSRVLTTTSPTSTPALRRSHGEDELSSSPVARGPVLEPYARPMMACGRSRSSRVMMDFQPDDLSLSCGTKRSWETTTASSSFESEVSDTSFGNGGSGDDQGRNPRLLNLFV